MRPVQPPTFDRPAPRSDPTNPYDQETVGGFEAARWANQRHMDEPGLTERDRDERAQAMGSRMNPAPTEPDA